MGRQGDSLLMNRPQEGKVISITLWVTNLADITFIKYSRLTSAAMDVMLILQNLELVFNMSYSLNLYPRPVMEKHMSNPNRGIFYELSEKYCQRVSRSLGGREDFESVRGYRRKGL